MELCRRASSIPIFSLGSCLCHVGCCAGAGTHCTLAHSAVEARGNTRCVWVKPRSSEAMSCMSTVHYSGLVGLAVSLGDGVPLTPASPMEAIRSPR